MNNKNSKEIFEWNWLLMVTLALLNIVVIDIAAVTAVFVSIFVGVISPVISRSQTTQKNCSVFTCDVSSNLKYSFIPS